MIYGSVCSGIEAATVAWEPLGWRPAFFAEIDKFPSAMLKHHYPEVRNHGDFTTIQAGEYAAIDLLVGGTPCQSFSVAGLRGGMDDARGQLALEFLRLADRLRPRWLVWENVPGVLSSNGGRDFGSFLGGLAELGYGFACRVLDAQFFGVPQRRRRVFVVGHLGDWRRAAAVLFERHSLSGHPPPRREAGQSATYDVAPCIGASGRGFERTGDTRGQDCLVAFGGNNTTGPIDVATACNAKGGAGRLDFETETLLAVGGFPDPYAIQAGCVRENPDSGPDGVGVREDGIAYTLEARAEVQAVAFSCKDHGADVGDIAPTLRSMGHAGSHANAGGQVAVAFALGSHSGCADGDQANRSHDSGGPVGSNISEELAYSLRSGRTQSVATTMAVRRLTPRECERLQGFPDDYTKISDKTADGPRYKALGNSMAVPVMRWIGERIQAVENVVNAGEQVGQV